MKERPDVGVYVKDLSAFVVNNADDMDKVMTMGNKHRMVGSTKMNERSSRSHAIFTITVECSERGLDGQQHFRVGKLHLVDLAGSERQVGPWFSSSAKCPKGVDSSETNPEQNRCHGEATTRGHQDQPLPVHSRQRDIRLGGRQKQSHSIQELQAHEVVTGKRKLG